MEKQGKARILGQYVPILLVSRCGI